MALVVKDHPTFPAVSWPQPRNHSRCRVSGSARLFTDKHDQILRDRAGLVNKKTGHLLDRSALESLQSGAFAEQRSFNLAVEQQHDPKQETACLGGRGGGHVQAGPRGLVRRLTGRIRPR